ncbi:major capsid family protein, partial [Staphylococcus epidermidis]|uniref:major capsid family protein n=1 Tax=Staphylococcus epidermidis TaxID=1282 RepID=UPI00254AC901
MTTAGQAAHYVDGADDIPVVDMNVTESASNLTDISIAVRYSRQQLGEAQQVGMDILTPMATRA